MWFDVHAGNFVKRPELVSGGEGKGFLSAMCGHKDRGRRYKTYIEFTKFKNFEISRSGLNGGWIGVPIFTISIPFRICASRRCFYNL